MASDKIPAQMSLSLADEPFKLVIGSLENGGGWSRSISIDDVAVWKMAMSKDEIKRKSEGMFTIDVVNGLRHLDYLTFEENV